MLSSLFPLSAATALSLVTASSRAQASAECNAESGSRAVGSIADKPLAAFQDELLDVAFSAATALPIVPHIKDRSRAQEAVVVACLELDQPLRALGYVEKIDNWRRGAGYADLAFYCAEHGNAAEAKRYLDLARRVAENPEDENPQGWRRDRILAKIAGTLILLGQTEQAAKLEAGLVDSESGQVMAVRATLLDADDFDAQIEALDAVIARGNFDQVRNALEACVQLFDRFYDDEDRRPRTEEKIKASWKNLPLMIRIELMMDLAGFALGHEDRGKALELVEEAEIMLEESTWKAEDYIPLSSRLAVLRHRAGDEEGARNQADAAQAMFHADPNQIVNMYRADALRPLAEAYQSMGDKAIALAVYRRAVEEGMENSNSRPRAEDLSATCCSMAVQGAEPDVALRALILKIHEGLGPPW